MSHIVPMFHFVQMFHFVLMSHFVQMVLFQLLKQKIKSCIFCTNLMYIRILLYQLVFECRVNSTYTITNLSTVLMLLLSFRPQLNFLFSLQGKLNIKHFSCKSKCNQLPTCQSRQNSLSRDTLSSMNFGD